MPAINRFLPTVINGVTILKMLRPIFSLEIHSRMQILFFFPEKLCDKWYCSCHSPFQNPRSENGILWTRLNVHTRITFSLPTYKIGLLRELSISNITFNLFRCNSFKFF